jgi:hypothetical protein
MIYGAIDDLMWVPILRYVTSMNAYVRRPSEAKDDVVNNAAGGEQNLASLTRVEGAGHLVSPLTTLVVSISDNLCSDRPNESSRSCGKDP